MEPRLKLEPKKLDRNSPTHHGVCVFLTPCYTQCGATAYWQLLDMITRGLPIGRLVNLWTL